MTRLLLTLTVGIFMLMAAGELASGHGGQLKPPGDAVPPNIGGPPGGSTPGGPGGPATPGNGGPAISGPRSPGQGTPSAPTVRGSGTGGMGRKPRRSALGYERWEFWWTYNKHRFLNLKSRLSGPSNVSGNSGFLVGRGKKERFNDARRPTQDMVMNNVLPCLHGALESDHPDILDSSVLAIARILSSENGSATVESITELLASTHPTVQQSASLSLGVLGSPRAIPICYELMINSREGQKLVNKSEVPQTVRAFAALSMGLIGEGETWTKLKNVVKHGNEKVQKELIGCAITALGLMGGTEQKPEIMNFLLKRLDDQRMDPFLRSYIPVALGKLGDRTALSRIMKEFKNPDLHDAIRQSCAIAIGLLADIDNNEEAVNILIKYIKEGKDVQSRHFSFMALADIGARDTEFEANSDRHEKLTRFLLRETVKPSRTGHRSWAALAAAVHARPHEDLHAMVINKIGETFMTTSNPSDKGAMAIGLGLLRSDSWSGMLLETLCETRDKALQGYLCVSLGLMNKQAALTRIRAIASNETNFSFRLKAATALGLMGDTEAVGILTDALARGRTLSVTLSAAKALGLIGDRNALDALSGIIENKEAHDMARAFAAVALGMICEKSDLPWNSVIAENCNYRAAGEALVEAIDIL